MAISCRVTRGDLTESIHVAFAVAVDENGQIFFSSGDPNYLTCIRSSLKPFQAAASIKTGAVDSVNFSNEEIALMCASHQGEQVHTNTAISMLKKMDLNIEDYECGAHAPSDKKTRYSLVKASKFASSIHNNCSGKHAGMLALAKYLGKGIKG
ncbi:MAG: L-asparaginase, partial [Candidatus Marinimicrobia bacterium]|nr:L-asparaginase [Candidatus Neomarinimicrobiota bacterium]